MIKLRRFLDVRPDEARRIVLMAAFLFFLLAANNVIKIVRDSFFLSRFPITQLPYVYLLAGFIAAIVVGAYSRYTSKLPFSRIILVSLAFVGSNVIIFWLLITLYEADWVFYVYYMWSAIVGLIMIAQFWTWANEMFTPQDGKRLFGIITAGGTLGAMMGGIMANWAVSFLVGTNQLLWFIIALFAGAYGAAYFAIREQEARVVANPRQDVATATHDLRGVVGTVLGSRYLQTIAALIFVSIVVSTLIDYQFKAMTKEAYPSADALAGFFGSYYAWLSVITLLAQLWLTGKLLTGLGLTPTLMFLPMTLLVGSMSILVWPGLFAATATRMSEASLRTSINQSGVQILYLPVPDFIKKKVKVFMDVTVERLGDGVAAIIILTLSLALGVSNIALLSYFSVALVVIWIAVVMTAHKGYVETLRRSLAYREISLETVSIDFTDMATVQTVLSTLDRMDEPSVFFGLKLAGKLDPKVVATRLPRALLSHPSPEVRRRALTLIASSLDPNVLAVVFEILTSESAQLRLEAINTAAAILKEAAIPVVLPLRKSPEAQTRRAAIRLMLQSGDPRVRQDAFADFRDLVSDFGPDGEISRVEAARLMGELEKPEFTDYLSRLIKEDPSPAVIREAMVAAARGGYRGVVQDVIARLDSKATRAGAHDALIQYGEVAVKGLRAALSDPRVPRDIRLNIPRTLSKIHAQPAMNALMAGLLEEDRSIRFKVILALEEMARRFADLKVDREIIESAIMSDALLCFRRFLIFHTLFSERGKSVRYQDSLLYHALTESMKRVNERVIWLLSLIYPTKDIRRAWSGLNSPEPRQRAHALELLDNLLAGEVKAYVFPLYNDGEPDRRIRMALDSLRIDSIDAAAALRALLAQDDRWLKAATVWEIGIRKAPGFGEILSQLARSDDSLLRETATIVIGSLQIHDD
jgi:ATP/ADP translocase/HEAT repeat protein